jgi:hypothetical protein
MISTHSPIARYARYFLLAAILTTTGVGRVFAAGSESAVETASDTTHFTSPKGATDAGNNLGLDWLRQSEYKSTMESQNYSYLTPLLKERYRGRQNLNVLEIGPLRTTSVAHALSVNTSIYLGVDVIKNAARAQEEFFEKEGLKNAEAIFGDVYELPVTDESQDVVIAFRSTPLGSVYATKDSLLRAYSEIARVLKPSGEFVLYPEQRKEIKDFDPCEQVFRELSRIEVPSGKGHPDTSWMIFYTKDLKGN